MTYQKNNPIFCAPSNTSIPVGVKPREYSHPSFPWNAQTEFTRTWNTKQKTSRHASTKTNIHQHCVIVNTVHLQPFSFIQIIHLSLRWRHSPGDHNTMNQSRVNYFILARNIGSDRKHIHLHFLYSSRIWNSTSSLWAGTNRNSEITAGVWWSS